MNEQQRVDYLQTMGYRLYYPRAILPGAKPSPIYDLPEPPAPAPDSARNSAPASSRTPGAATHAAGGLAAARQILQSETGPPSAAAATRAGTNQTDRGGDSDGTGPGAQGQSLQAGRAPAAGRAPVGAASTAGNRTTGRAATPGSGQEQLTFRLRYYGIDQHLAVLSEEPFEMRRGQGKDSTDLLTAILKSIKPGFDSELNSVTFDFQKAARLAAADPKRAAKLAIEGFIGSRHADEGFSNILLFTFRLGGLFNEQSPAEPCGDVQLNAGAMNCQMTITHSLHLMLAKPELKRETWAHLQPLRKRLQAGNQGTPD